MTDAMKSAAEEWIATSRQKLNKGHQLQAQDLDKLASAVAAPRQLILYLTAKSTNLRSAVVGWVLYDPTREHKPTLPSDEPPYESVLAAVGDGWRVAQFPAPSSYQFKDLENDYVGFDFVLEKWV